MTDECIELNKYVEFTYQILDQTGEIVERVDMPVSYVHGANSGMLEKIELALQGRKIGETVNITILPEDGFGEWNEDLTFTDALDNVPEHFRTIGAEVEMHNDVGETKTFVVSEISDGRLTVDGNYPLAGKTLTFMINVLGIRDATEDEIRTGRGAEPSSMLH